MLFQNWLKSERRNLRFWGFNLISQEPLIGTLNSVVPLLPFLIFLRRAPVLPVGWSRFLIEPQESLKLKRRTDSGLRRKSAAVTGSEKDLSDASLNLANPSLFRI